MKAAMWGVGLLVMGLFGIVLINLFGNITVTNQFNYTTMKNAVQAAMYDSLDVAHYRAGFCLCKTNGSAIDLSKQTVFNNTNEYSFLDIVDDKCGGEDNKTNCVQLYGQYRLDAKKFEEIFKERFDNVKTNDKEYSFIIKDAIEYPPKVSVRVISHDNEFSPTEKDSGGYNIVNEISAIVETSGEITVETMACYQNGNQLEWGSASDHSGWTIVEGVNSSDDCKRYTVITHHYVEGTKTPVHADDVQTIFVKKNYTTNYYSSSSLLNGYKNYKWNGKNPSNKTGSSNKETTIEVTYYYKNATDQYTVITHHYVSQTKTEVHKDDVQTIALGKAYETKYYKSSSLNSGYKDYKWNGKEPSNKTGSSNVVKTIEVTYYYEKVATFKVTVHHYIEGTTTSVVTKDDVVTGLTSEGETTISPKASSGLLTAYKNYSWNKAEPKNIKGYTNSNKVSYDSSTGKLKLKVIDGDIEMAYYYKANSSGIPVCGYHYKVTTMKCHNKTTLTTPSYVSPSVSCNTGCTDGGIVNVNGVGEMRQCNNCPSNRFTTINQTITSANRSYTNPSDVELAKRRCKEAADDYCKTQGNNQGLQSIDDATDCMTEVTYKFKSHNGSISQTRSFPYPLTRNLTCSDGGVSAPCDIECVG